VYRWALPIKRYLQTNILMSPSASIKKHFKPNKTGICKNDKLKVQKFLETNGKIR